MKSILDDRAITQDEYDNSDDVSKITPDGTSTIFGTIGSYPWGIAPDAAGSVYTANPYSSNVSKITGTSTATFAATGDTSPITITGLTNDTEHLISLIAVNAVGESAASNSVSVTPVSTPTAPDAPTIDSIAVGDGQVVIAVTPGAENGLPITGYTAICAGGTGYHLGTSPTSPITVSGLTSGQPYACLATATNAVGTSPISESSAPVTTVAPAPGC